MRTFSRQAPVESSDVSKTRRDASVEREAGKSFTTEQAYEESNAAAGIRARGESGLPQCVVEIGMSAR